MDLIWLEDFLAIAEEGGFSRAAERRHVTQPALSRRIKVLEEVAGHAADRAAILHADAHARRRGVPFRRRETSCGACWPDGTKRARSPG